MASLYRHLQTHGPEHERLGFRPDCPLCRDHLADRYPAPRLLTRRGEAAAATALVAAAPGGSPLASISRHKAHVQPDLRSLRVLLVELRAGGEPIAVRPRPAARGGRQRFHLDVEVPTLAQQVDMAISDPAEVPAQRARWEGVHLAPRDAPLAGHRTSPS